MFNWTQGFNEGRAGYAVGAIGGVVKGFVTDNIWLGAQMHDANAASGDFGYTPSFGQRKSHLIQFTYWEKDARALAGTTKGSGWAVSSAWRLNDRLFPFVRFGHSDGGGGVAAEDAVTVGVEVTKRFAQTWTIGAGWAKPSRETFGPGRELNLGDRSSRNVRTLTNSTP